MPEIPDVDIYVEALAQRVTGAALRGLDFRSPFLLRSVSPSPSDLAGLEVSAVRRVAKRIAVEFDNGPWVAIHLMRAGRLRWRDQVNGRPIRNEAARLTFDTGVLAITEAGKRRRAALHIVPDEAALKSLSPPGVDAETCTAGQFEKAMRGENHTLKRALTDQRILAGIGNAYSDEILHRAGLSPFQMTQKITESELTGLYTSMRETLSSWTERLREELAGSFPEKVTAFRPGMAVHGRFGEPCPVCDAPVQRIRYADSETNYCPGCQTGGRIYADRSLSRLLRDDWPRNLDQLEST